MNLNRCFFCGKYMSKEESIYDNEIGAPPTHNECFEKAFFEEWGDRYLDENGSFDHEKYYKDHIITIIPSEVDERG